MQASQKRPPCCHVHVRKDVVLRLLGVRLLRVCPARARAGRSVHSPAQTMDTQSNASACALSQHQLSISCAFDSGNIDVLNATDPQNIQLRIRPDPFCDRDGRQHFQWFHFAVSCSAASVPLTMRIVNAGEASYPEGWRSYSAVRSSDGVAWTRVPTTYDEENGIIEISDTPPAAYVRYAYWAPYSLERLAAFVMAMQARACPCGGHPAWFRRRQAA